MCLCIQNNIAEVGELHGELMVQSFLDHICSLLHSPEVEVSYFAAGILAHLTSRGEKVWTLDMSLRNTLLEQLVRSCANRSQNCLGITPEALSKWLNNHVSLAAFSDSEVANARV